MAKYQEQWAGCPRWLQNRALGARHSTSCSVPKSPLSTQAELLLGAGKEQEMGHVGPTRGWGRGHRPAKSGGGHRGGLVEKLAFEQRLLGLEESQAGHCRPSSPPRGLQSRWEDLDTGVGVGMR